MGFAAGFQAGGSIGIDIVKSVSERLERQRLIAMDVQHQQEAQELQYEIHEKLRASRAPVARMQAKLRALLKEGELSPEDASRYMMEMTDAALQSMRFEMDYAHELLASNPANPYVATIAESMVKGLTQRYATAAQGASSMLASQAQIEQSRQATKREEARLAFKERKWREGEPDRIATRRYMNERAARGGGISLDEVRAKIYDATNERMLSAMPDLSEKPDKIAEFREGIRRQVHAELYPNVDYDELYPGAGTRSDAGDGDSDPEEEDLEEIEAAIGVLRGDVMEQRVREAPLGPGSIGLRVREPSENLRSLEERLSKLEDARTRISQRRAARKSDRAKKVESQIVDSALETAERYVDAPGRSR